MKHLPMMTWAVLAWLPMAGGVAQTTMAELHEVVSVPAEAPWQGYGFQPAAAPTLVFRPAPGAPPWSGHGEWRIELVNRMPWAITLTLQAEGDGGERLQATVGVPAGPAQTLVLPLRPLSPRDFGMQAGPPMPFESSGRRLLLATTVTGTPLSGALRAVRVSMPAPQAPQQVWFAQPRTHPDETAVTEAYRAIVDGFGQYTRGNWPEKIADTPALRAAQAREAATRPPAPAGGDRYGGRPGVVGLTATGWFHAQKAAGCWWLVTPEGGAFFSLGVDAVDPGEGRSHVQGREWMFRGLPPREGPWRTFYGEDRPASTEIGARAGLAFASGTWFDFYAANLYRADGADGLSAWRARTLARLAAWGFNTLGAWSEPALGAAHRLAYTRTLTIAGAFGNVATGQDWWGRMPDPFDPRFAEAAEAAAARASAGARDDPWLLGYFLDNELPWAGPGAQGRWALARGTLAGMPISHAKRAFIAELKRRYGSAARLAAAWGLALQDWTALEATGFVAPVPEPAHPAIAADYAAWQRRYAETYFDVAVTALRRHDPHHLILGARFASSTPEAIEASARRVDVLSFNVYADLPQHGLDRALLQRLDRPLLIGEFHFGSDDRGPFGKGLVPVWNEAGRGEAYARYLSAAAGDPLIVGAHWFAYADQPVSGRLLDGENSHIGLVGITDLPFTGFVEAVRKANLRALERAAKTCREAPCPGDTGAPARPAD